MDESFNLNCIPWEIKSDSFLGFGSFKARKCKQSISKTIQKIF